MSSKRTVVRCRLCGAALKNPTEVVVTCRYCDSDNVIEVAPHFSDVAAAQLRADEMAEASRQAQAMVPEVQARSAEIEEEMNAAVERYVMGRGAPDGPFEEDLTEAARLFEAYFRLQQMPGLLIAGAAGPMGAEMFERVDEAALGAVKQFTDGLRGQS